MKGPRIFASRLASLISLSVVLAALIGVALADAQSQSPGPTGPHLLVVPDTPEGEAALAHSDARVVAGYQSFTLVEASGADDQRLRRAGADRRDDMRTVRTAAGELDPRSARQSLAGKEAPDREDVLALVQFVGPPKEAWVERLRTTGARIVNYQAENAYVVHAGGDEVDRLAALVGGFAPVRAVSVLTAADKLETPRSPTGQYAVQTVAGAEGSDAREDAAAAGTGVARGATIGALRTQYLALTAGEAAELARHPAVAAIEPYADPELADERAAQIVAGNLTSDFEPDDPDYLDWLVDPARIPDPSTFDFAIDVTDEGLDNGANPPAHPDFLTQGSAPSRVAYLNNYSSDSDARDCGGHGTNVASIATGYNSSTAAAFEDLDGFNHGLGVAPFARLGVSKIFSCDGGFLGGWTPAGLASNAHAQGARISNNSWGTSGPASWGDYSARAQQYDQVVRSQRMVEVFAAGNDGDEVPGAINEGYGTILAEGTAKNVITVGAGEGVHASGDDDCGPPPTPNAGADSALDIVNFSSRGPTDDGRLKPDLVAPGTHITGARPQHPAYTGQLVCTDEFDGPFYTLISGSSQAAPQVSGAAALVRRWYAGTASGEASPALTKALLINTASDLAGGENGKGDTIAAGPNTDQGWGRVNVGAALDSAASVFRDQRPEDILGGSGAGSDLPTYAVDDPTRPVKVTLAWTDAPGPVTGDSFVNNLDLEVAAGGRTYKGNVFAGAVSRTGGSADTRNNVESVYLPENTSGSFSVKVTGANLPGDGVPGNGDSTDQDFALVVSNAREETSPVLVHDTTTVDDSGGDGDGALEIGESFELSERLRNSGDAGATGVSGSLTSDSPGLTITQDFSSWPDIAEGASETNTPTFTGALASPAPCGADARATLALTSAQGSQSVPLVLETGVVGEPVQRTSSPGASIPDDDAAGVTSTINVPTAGRIKDLDVRITDIDHTWVGDLRIDITGPDGTTVKLAEHPGGPDNAGDDFTDTIFDDEASPNISSGSAPYTGRFRPQNDQLSRFDGNDQQGAWTLRVRDLFEGDTGVLRSWGTGTSPAECEDGPQTTIDSGPVEAATVGSKNETFDFSSNAPGASFECALDAGGFAPCSPPRSYVDLAEGPHTFRVRAVHAGKSDPTPATRVWTVDTSPPNTAITSGPTEMSRLSGNSAVFRFMSPDASDASFECSIDGTNFLACAMTHVEDGLAEGAHTFRVRARDAVGNVDASPATRTWTVDRIAPSVTLTAPLSGSRTTESAPVLAGVAGTSPGDNPTVVLKVWRGTHTSGVPVQTIVVPRNGVTGAFAARPEPLADGWYTVRVEQGDAAVPENIGFGAAATIAVSAAPSFAVAPVQDRLSDALANRYTVLAACASACEATAGLSVSSRGARKLGLRARRTAIGRGVKRLRKAGTAAVMVRLTRSARKALSRRSSAKVTLEVTLKDGDRRLTLARTVSLRRSAGLRSVARRGLGLWTVCSQACPLSGDLTVSASDARRLGMKPKTKGRVEIATGAVRGRSSPTRLSVKVKRSVKKALGRRSKLAAQLEVTAGTAPDANRSARRSITLRR